MNRWKAATIHLTVSLVLALAIATLLYFLWFPSPYFIAAGASKLIMVLMGVDIGIGPLLTLLVVSPHKPRSLLRLDLSVIAVMQAIAFAYGVHVIAVARPVFVVAAVDRLVLVSADELTDTDLAQGNQPVFRTRSWTGPLLVGVWPPKGGKGFDVVQQVLAGGKDLDQLPRFYMPYDQVVDKLMQRAKPLSQLKNVNTYQRKQLEQIQAGADDGGTLLALPLQRGDRYYTAIMSPKTRRPMRILSIDPW
ncbi:TfpX/TfpZ family type IV pilin accessory protein [Dyella sp. S184]|uniref:TfpX/TfpZ family type IV pilin accessory protein n=1 Tax=Dyella sp. S184 TaxID=1641862 RepID=UPI00131C6058|nr:TfpX/TfpZ family type IV pilin accessory protein [Dyella sp. S184]